MKRVRMRTALITVATAVAAVVATTGATGAPTSHTARCGSGVGPIKYSTIEPIKGKQVIVNCGPATAKLHYKGGTYAFKHGTCFRYLRSFKLNLGNSPLVPVAGKRGGYINMSITATPSGGAEVGAAFGKTSLYVAVKWTGAAVKGTFSSITNGVTATGSWNCGGTVHKT